jgi:hypothetical protein
MEKVQLGIRKREGNKEFNVGFWVLKFRNDKEGIQCDAEN